VVFFFLWFFTQAPRYKCCPLGQDVTLAVVAAGVDAPGVVAAGVAVAGAAVGVGAAAWATALATLRTAAATAFCHWNVIGFSW
jgi:hypothetical protein